MKKSKTVWNNKQAKATSNLTIIIIPAKNYKVYLLATDHKQNVSLIQLFRSNESFLLEEIKLYNKIEFMRIHFGFKFIVNLNLMFSVRNLPKDSKQCNYEWFVSKCMLGRGRMGSI